MYETIKGDSCIIYRFLVQNSDRNINYILAPIDSNECIVIDPLDKDGIEEILKNENLFPQYIVNTHAHPDHIKYNSYFLKKYSCKLLAHNFCKDLFEFKFDNIFENDLIILNNLRIKVLHTPGHCPEQISLIIDNCLLCGDTVFNCGVGNTKFRGDIVMLYRTIFHKIKNLPDDILILPGHDYLYNNILFLESLYEDQGKIHKELIELKINFKQENLSPIKDLAFEKKHNPFFRVDELSFWDLVKNKNLFANEEIQYKFRLLRQVRDEW